MAQNHANSDLHCFVSTPDSISSRYMIRSVASGFAYTVSKAILSQIENTSKESKTNNKTELFSSPKHAQVKSKEKKKNPWGVLKILFY